MIEQLNSYLFNLYSPVSVIYSYVYLPLLNLCRVFTGIHRWATRQQYCFLVVLDIWNIVYRLYMHILVHTQIIVLQNTHFSILTGYENIFFYFRRILITGFPCILLIYQSGYKNILGSRRICSFN